MVINPIVGGLYTYVYPLQGFVIQILLQMGWPSPNTGSLDPGAFDG